MINKKLTKQEWLNWCRLFSLTILERCQFFKGGYKCDVITCPNCKSQGGIKDYILKRALFCRSCSSYISFKEVYSQLYLEPLKEKELLQELKITILDSDKVKTTILLDSANRKFLDNQTKENKTTVSSYLNNVVTKLRLKSYRKTKSKSFSFSGKKESQL